MINFEKICRTCSSEGELQSLFIEDPFIIADMLNQIVDIKINKDDNFPQNICIYCLEKLKSAYYFIQQCQDVNIKLKEYMKSDAQTLIECKTDESFINEENSSNKLKTESDDEFNDEFVSYSTVEFYVDNSDIEDVKLHVPDKDEKTNKKEGVKKIECKICLKTMHQVNYQRHLKTHTGERPYVCASCGKDFIQKVALQAHMRKHTGERPYNCNHCEKSFKHCPQLFCHIKGKHIEEIKPSTTGEFKCNKCNEKFASKKILQSHKLFHKETKQQTIAKSYLCNHCGKAFPSNSKLQEHIRTHTGEKPYKCNTCDKSFKSYSVLHSHRRTHATEKPFKCSFCEKLFSSKLTLNVHELIHTGGKPYKCDICNQRFRQRTHLKYHSYTHTGETPHKCSHCDKQFALKGNLTVHMRTHTGETPYVCPICDKGFYDSSSMKRHKKKHLLVENDTEK